MPRTIERSASGVWWLLGAFCMMLFGARPVTAQAVAKYGVPQPPYGIPPPPPVVAPKPDEAQVKKAQDLVAKYLQPVEAQKPTDAQQKDIDSAIAALKGEDKAKWPEARTSLVKIGPAALGALRELAGPDAASSTPPAAPAMQATAAIRAIESAARAPIVKDLAAVGETAQWAVLQKSQEAQAEQATIRRQVEEATDKGDQEALTKALAAQRTARARILTLRTLAMQLNAAIGQPSNPGPVVKYGPPNPQPIPPPAYGPPPNPQPLPVPLYGPPPARP